jgi:peptide/nickel transport system ATP-binding protein
VSSSRVDETAPLLSLRGLRVEAPGALALVEEIEFEIRAGETLCLVGESGCGKSLTALSIPRLLPAGLHMAAGDIRWRGRELTRLDEAALRGLRGAEIGFIFQEPMSSLNPVLTVGVQIAETLLAHGKADRAAARRRAGELLAEVGVPDPVGRLSNYPHELSGGLRQRVMIAMALACDPALLIADEPSTALDVSVQAQVLELLRSLCERRGLALLLITHDLGVVAELGQRVLVMYAGQIVEAASVAELFAAPLHPYTRALMDSLPRLEGEAMPTGIPGAVPRPGLAPAGCRFRDRCTLAASVCEEEQPLRELGGGRALRCCKGAGGDA